MPSYTMQLKAGVAALVVALLGTAAFAADGTAKAGRVPLPKATVAKGDKCVEPTDVMRRDHMKFIMHQRDDTMHRGIRTTRHSLTNCINCHADPATGSVQGKDGFCAKCHNYAAVTVDCFSCHNDKATTKTGAAPASPNLARAIGAVRNNQPEGKKR